MVKTKTACIVCIVLLIILAVAAGTTGVLLFSFEAKNPIKFVSLRLLVSKPATGNLVVVMIHNHAGRKDRHTKTYKIEIDGIDGGHQLDAIRGKLAQMITKAGPSPMFLVSYELIVEDNGKERIFLATAEMVSRPSDSFLVGKPGENPNHYKKFDGLDASIKEVVRMLHAKYIEILEFLGPRIEEGVSPGKDDCRNTSGGDAAEDTRRGTK